jgi:predicted CoA-binding protein
MDTQASAIDYPQLFRTARTWAIVGYSDNPERAGHFVPQYLKRAGYRVLAINPKFGSEVDGVPCYPSLEAIPAEEEVDVVDIFRAPPHLPDVLADTLKMAHLPRYFWMQPGAENVRVAEQAAAAGLTPIMHSCALAVHKTLKAQGEL